jgi:hypothetical protein
MATLKIMATNNIFFRLKYGNFGWRNYGNLPIYYRSTNMQFFLLLLAGCYAAVDLFHLLGLYALLE